MRGGIALTDERKKLCLYTGVNFLVGIIVGTVLFYANMRSNPQGTSADYCYTADLNIIDVLRVWWLNIMWLFSAFIAHTVLTARPIHIIVGVRGTVSAFSALYLLEAFGIKELTVSLLPQCTTILPVLMCFSVLCVEKRRKHLSEGKEPFSVSRSEAGLIFLICAVTAVAESVFFSILSRILL